MVTKPSKSIEVILAVNLVFLFDTVFYGLIMSTFVLFSMAGILELESYTSTVSM